MYTRWNSITDAAGRRWLCCQIRNACRISGIDPALLAPRERRFSAAQALKLGLLSGPAFGLFMVLWFELIPPSGAGMFRFGWIDLIMLVCMAVFFGASMGIACRFILWRSSEDARDAMLEYDLCPHCAHGIWGIPADSEGRTVCPECSAAWKIDGQASPNA